MSAFSPLNSLNPLVNPLAEAPNEPTARDGVIARARGVIDVEIEALEFLKNRIGEDFFRAIALMETVKGRVVVTGMGKSGIMGRKIAATLSSTGTPAYFLHPAEGSHGDLGVLMPQDVVLAISNSGETAELLGILPTIKRLGVPMIAMTANPESTLAQRSDVFLDISVPKEACPLNLAPTASTTATVALGDALAVCLLERKGFTPDDFALFHPSGALGKRLLLKVDDLMHGGDALPVVDLETPFLDALLEMTGKKLGLTLVLDGQGQMAGILTDGDVRRAMTRFHDAREIVIAEVMTRTPQTVVLDTLAVSALRLMEEKKITALIVVDGDSRPVGVVHMHDILKTGIT